MKKWMTPIAFLFLVSLQAQDKGQKDALYLKEIYNHSLSRSQCYYWLDTLTNAIGPRLSGTKNNLTSVDYTFKLMQSFGLDTVFKQEHVVKGWERGEEEIMRITEHNGIGQDILFNPISLGNTIGTGEGGIEAEVIEVHSLDTLDLLRDPVLRNKIVFFNRPMDPTQINTGHAYGKAVDQRVAGASKAAQYGALAVIVRSITTALDDVPHTGVCVYKEGVKQIPALAISTIDADLLSEKISSGSTKVYLENHCRFLGTLPSYNVVGEIRGSTYPEEIILVGGHLDSWDIGGGAHDDGAGCVHSLQVIKNIIDMGYEPNRTIRCVMFNNEENGLAGGTAYAEASNAKGEFHLAAIESDAGGFTPRGFSCTAMEEVFPDHFRGLNAFSDLLGGYDLFLKKGGGGADINPLKSQGGLLIGFRPDQARYFDYHHTAADVLSNVNKRELELGAAAITGLVYLIDQYGLNNE